MPSQSMRLRKVDGGENDAEVNLQVVLQSESYDTLFRAAIDGAGVTVLPRSPAEDFFATGALVHLLPGWIFGRYTVYVALPTRKLIPARTRAFLDFATDMSLGPRLKNSGPNADEDVAMNKIASQAHGKGGAALKQV